MFAPSSSIIQVRGRVDPEHARPLRLPQSSVSTSPSTSALACTRLLEDSAILDRLNCAVMFLRSRNVRFRSSCKSVWHHLGLPCVRLKRTRKAISRHLVAAIRINKWVPSFVESGECVNVPIACSLSSSWSLSCAISSAMTHSATSSCAKPSSRFASRCLLHRRFSSPSSPSVASPTTSAPLATHWPNRNASKSRKQFSMCSKEGIFLATDEVGEGFFGDVDFDFGFDEDGGVSEEGREEDAKSDSPEVYAAMRGGTRFSSARRVWVSASMRVWS